MFWGMGVDSKEDKYLNAKELSSLFCLYTF